MIVRAGIGQWLGRASARALDLPGGPVLTSDTGSDRLPPDQLFGAGNRGAADRAGHQLAGQPCDPIPGRHETTVRESADQVRAMLISGWQDLGTRFTEFG